ncbi:MAG: hypothetical protein RL748_1927 [Pseudomonadota bacterium]|jgi:membrane associated rhomboid family serine protease
MNAQSLMRFLRAAPLSTSFALICIAMYLLMLASGAHFADPHSRAMIEWGGNYRALTLNHQSWRIFTAMFLHGSLLHISLNSIAIFDICYLLEQRIGAWRLGLVLLLSGLSASLCSLIWGPLLVSFGASGAIMGAAGCLLVWLIMTESIAKNPLPFIALLAGISLPLGLGMFWHRLDNSAHIAGLLVGMMLGALLFAVQALGPRRQVQAQVLMLVAGLLLIGTVLRKQNRDEYRFLAQLPAIDTILQQYARPQNFLSQAQPDWGRALQGWQQCLQISAEWPRLRLNKRQELLALQIGNVCKVQQQTYLMLARSKATPRQIMQHPQFLQYQLQAQNLYANLLPGLSRELEVEFAIQSQIGPLAKNPLQLPGGR